MGSLPQHVVDKFERAGTSNDMAAFAFVTDQLSEEQESSFTLDTAQAHFRTAGKCYTLIDTPGHREFLKNMVTGANRADAAILVVDANEGPLPQTYLHTYLIPMLDIGQVIVAINKMDLVSYDCHRFHLLSQQLSSRVFWISQRSLEANSRIKVLCGTQSHWGCIERVAKVIDPISLETIGTDVVGLNNFQVGEIIVRTESPMCIDPFDFLPELGRFAILQDGRIAGGAVIVR